MPALGEFVPELPVSVIVPYCGQSEELARTLAALEVQTYPRELFEVVVVDDGSPEPLQRPGKSPLDVKVVRQEDRSFVPVRARNTGVCAAAHDVLLFLDADMLPEADWLAAHARWHHVVPDALTLGLRAHVSMDGVDPGMIRNRPGTLKELFEGREVDDVRWIDRHMSRTDDLTSKADDPFRVVASGNLGIRRGFFDLVGGFDESFTQWGGEDTEFGYRAHARGGLLVPLRDAFAWRQGAWEAGRAEKQRRLMLQRAKLAHLIAHPDYRTGLAGRTFTVPQYVVTIEGGDLPKERLLEAVARVLSGPMHDLVVRLELARDHPGREWLERHLGPDPRVRVAPSLSALEEFPASPFQVALRAGWRLHGEMVRQLRSELGTAVIGRAVFPDGTRASIVRTWALHRALRTPWDAADFGDVVTIPSLTLAPPGPTAGSARPAPAPAGSPATGGTHDRLAKRILEKEPAPAGSPATGSARHRAPRTAWARLRARLRQVDGPVSAWRFVRWLAGAVLRRVSGRFRAAPPRRAPGVPVDAPPSPPVKGAAAFPPRAEYPLGVEIAALGARSQAVFAASRRVARTTAGGHLDLVVADTAAEAAGAAVPVVVLAESPPMLSVPAFDPRTDNPIGWRRDAGNEVGALGPLDRLPPGCGADRVVLRDDREALGRIRHLEDVAAFHADAVTRAGVLVRLAATGVVVHLADGDRRLAAHVGAELFELMTREVRGLDIDGREALGARMRRAALREHSLTSRVRQVAERVLADPPRLPLVSVLLATRRPELLERALAAVRRQTYPRLELMLGLHGEGFGEAAPVAAGPSAPVTALRLDASLPLGSVLNALTDAAGGTLLTKMDDDDVYGPDHIWDLVLAHEYSQAPLVGKMAEFVYLAASDRTVRRRLTVERFVETISGGALLIERRMLDRIGGWKRLPRQVDQALIHDTLRAGARIYRTHPYGLVLVRHGRGHTWETDDTYFLEQANIDEAGFRPHLADISDAATVFDVEEAEN